AALAASIAGTGWLLRHPAIGRLADQPNARSAHRVPTPRGGGLAIVATTSICVAALYLSGRIPASITACLDIGALAVAAVGFRDDIKSTPVAVRMAVHFGAALLAVALLGGGVTELPVGSLLLHLGAAGSVICTLAIVWTLNLFNFMDGIDGIAASEATFVLFASAAISVLASNASWEQAAPSLVVGSACLGFLVWNWSPASIFMGDVGSGYLGYILAVIGVDSVRDHVLNVYVWLILGGVFFVDATLTLIRRLARRERVHQAHRSHAYQRLARRWGSHARTTAAVIAIDVLWLLPCATLAEKYPPYSAWICALALIPLAAAAFACGAGKAE
ncbi:MAG TPA: glycosyltransferase family 4 protein, partial [Steroidobacteraceae bacterium]|nr:glycosyltransferase family 4 protein [Steroidobacteraceae bacterium]